MKKLFIIQDDDLTYVCNVKKNKIKLNYSNSDIWNESAKGKFIGKLIDDGNCIEITINDKNIKLNYDEFVELLILSKLKKMNDDNLMSDESYLIEENIAG